jgi:hypothetical protein
LPRFKYAQFGAMAKAADFGIALHEGRQMAARTLVDQAVLECVLALEDAVAFHIVVDLANDSAGVVRVEFVDARVVQGPRPGGG